MESDYQSLVTNYHYSFFNESTSQAKIYYVYFGTASGPNYIELTNGKSVTDALNEMLYNDNVNTNDSTIKTFVDNWYKTNMTSYTSKLEDIIFCNDRSTTTINGWNPDGGDVTEIPTILYKNYNSAYASLACPKNNDKFTVSSSTGNGKLTYPVGLLTLPEVNLSAYGVDHYLSDGLETWLLSPSNYGSYAVIRTIRISDIRYNSPENSLGVRPVISLKPDTEFTEGDGSFTSPYVIK